MALVAMTACSDSDSASEIAGPAGSSGHPDAAADASLDASADVSVPEPSLEAAAETTVEPEAGPVCVPKTCAQMEYTCGKAPDGCGGVIECGACATGQICGGAGAPNKCGDNPCQVRTCAQMNASCGIASDGCADVLDCGGCAAPSACGGGGTPNQCGCLVKTCAQMGLTCGEAPDGCGGVVSCGQCAAGQTCGASAPNQCGAGSCTPKTCAQLQVSCGVVSDGCSATVDCGTCTSPEVCGGGGKQNQCGCLPKTCAQLGASCGEINDGCGHKVQCGSCDDQNPCTVGDACQSGLCVPGNPVECSTPPNASCYETTGTCDKVTGDCSYAKRGAGTPCEADSDACTGDVCDGLGTCVLGAAKTCTTPPDPGCYEPIGTCNPANGVCSYQPKAQGTACDSDGNACTVGDACDGAGLCIAGALKTCAAPPNTTCYNATGTCNTSTGACTYSPKPSGTACNADNNACTVGDTCNASGTCVAGAAKSCNSPPNTACYNATGTCNTSTGACSYTKKTDGTSCGTCKECSNGTCGNAPNGTDCGANKCFYCSSGACTARAVGYQYDGTESHRCCGSPRVQVDISANENHCGGCGLNCATGETCQSVSATTSCSPHPASTSGRCTCDSNNECPTGRNGLHQTCRTSTPYANVCAPSTAEYCSSGEAFQNVSGCPNYCYYP